MMIENDIILVKSSTTTGIIHCVIYLFSCLVDITGIFKNKKLSPKKQTNFVNYIYKIAINSLDNHYIIAIHITLKNNLIIYKLFSEKRIFI